MSGRWPRSPGIGLADGLPAAEDVENGLPDLVADRGLGMTESLWSDCLGAEGRRAGGASRRLTEARQGCRLRAMLGRY